MDYRELLKKYMALVIEWDGDDYLRYIHDEFSDDEKTELKKISHELENPRD